MIKSILSVTAALAFGMVIGYDYASKIAEIDKLEIAQQLSSEKVAVIAELAKKSKESSDRVAEIDRQFTEIANEKNKEIEDLRAALDSGAKRLRIASSKAASCGVPRATNSTGVGNDRSPELDSVFRSDYLDLRRSIEQKEAQLRACQEILGGK